MFTSIIPRINPWKNSNRNILEQSFGTAFSFSLRLEIIRSLFRYSCGPTVYDSSHIGHASTYVTFDIIHRVLKRVFNYNIVLMMGITDIDDKIIQRSQKV